MMMMMLLMMMMLMLLMLLLLMMLMMTMCARQVFPPCRSAPSVHATVGRADREQSFEFSLCRLQTSF